ncbi:hypothetical protein Tco_0968619 [Tanacetum coccineum]
MSASNQQTLIDLGANERPQMLEKGNYIPWESRHSRLMDEFDKFKGKEGESLESVYERLITLVDITDRNNVRPMQFEPHIQASKAKRAARNHDPLALIAHSNASSSQSHASPSYSNSPQPYYVTHPSSVVDYEEDYQGELQGDSQEDNLTTAINQVVIQDGRVDIETKNAGYGGNGNRNAGRQNRNQAFNAGNGLTHNDESNQIVQRVPRTESNPRKANVQCYKCNGKGHYACDCQKPRVRDAKFFREQMLLAMKDEARSNLKDEENDFMLDNSYGDETLEELTIAVNALHNMIPKGVHEHKNHGKRKTIINTSDDDQIDSNTIFDDPYVENNGGSAEHDSNAHDPYHDIKILAYNVQREAENQKRLNNELKKQKELLQKKLETCKAIIDQRPRLEDETAPGRIEENEDGFTTVKSRKRKGKRADTVQACNFEGIKLSKPKPNFVWSVKSNQASTTSKKANTDDEIPDTTNKKATDVNAKRVVNVINESDSEDVDQEIVLETHPGQYANGASTLSKDVSHVSWCSKGTRIILGWNSNNVDINVVSQDDQAMHARVWIKADKKEVFCLFIYAHNRYSQHRALWENLGKHKFKECVENIEVLDIPRSGLQYTWNQKPKGSSSLLKKLDRVMANMEFNDAFVGVFAVFQLYRTSDHSLVVLKIPISAKGGPKPFKFTNFLTGHDRFMDVVKMGWSIHVSGFLMYRVVKKLKYLKKPFCKLLYEKGNLHDNVERLRVELDQVQRDLDIDPSNAILREEEAIYVQAYNDALITHERFLKQKAKVEWLRVGDSNSAYFHKAIKSKISRNRINVVTTLEGETFTDKNVAKAFVNHYEVFLGQPGITTPFCDVNLFYNRLDVEDAAAMVRSVTSQEVKEAMFSMGNDKAPGPDGYIAAFLRNHGILFLRMLIMAVQEFFVNGKLLKELNHTIIALIPKVTAPSRINDYRPISCCNVLFKCISKINANRIKECLKGLISPNQSAFVLRRPISDNILLTQELMHNYHLDRGTPICAFKVDIQKAYDTVDWEFLRMGKRGLRQGDPLSPYLFTLIMESLSIFVLRMIYSFLLTGTPESATVIMEALDEFKNASGLVPSLPKSTTYFCNVLNYTKHAILQILPFEEGRLPVKYLGVPLVSSQLIYRDCKELIEKVQQPYKGLEE